MLYQNLLDEIVDKSKKILKEDLTGIYLHGSLVMGCFNPDKSDIDLIIVINNSITDLQKLQFMNYVVEWNKTAPDKGIELSIVRKEYCQNFLYPTPFELHFSNTHLQWFIDDPTDYIHKMNGTDKDLAAHFKIIKEYGVVLQGEEIEDVFADVPRKDYIDSIWSDVEGAGEDIADEPVYVILNLCRTAAFLRNGLILSKKQGGEWALQNLPAQYHTLISNALQSYGNINAMDVDTAEAKKFADHMLRMIKEENTMHKLAILSDTHGLLRPEIMEKLRGCEAILHGGDINNQTILDKLHQIAPVYVVRGNNDKEWAQKIPETLHVTLFGVRFFMVHNKKKIPGDLKDIDVVIYGHSHKYEEKRIGETLYVNPGSCGPRRFTQPVTMALLRICDDKPLQIEKIEIPGPLCETQRQTRGNKEASCAENAACPEEKKIPTDIKRIIKAIMRDTTHGKSVGEMSESYGISEELTEQICRLYLTHPGVDADGIMGKMGL